MDISKQAGDGEVILKNQPLDIAGHLKNDMYENLSVVKHNNDKDYWLIHRARRYFFVWKVTKDGFSTSQTFDTGVDQGVYPAGVHPGMGYIKFSPDGKKVIHMDARNSNTYITLADFDNESGIVSDIKNINSNIPYLYGVEFSPNGEYVYITTHAGAGAYRGLYIKHIDDLVLPSVNLTRTVANITNVQLAADGRIYAIASQNRSLWAILDPNEGGTQIVQFSNLFPSGRQARQGLPPFITSFFSLKGDKSFCMKTSKDFTVFTSGNIDGTTVAYTQWNWGDGSTEEKVMGSGQQVKSHTYKRSGKFTITVSAYSNADALLGSSQTMEVKVASCIMPVNHNISVTY